MENTETNTESTLRKGKVLPTLSDDTNDAFNAFKTLEASDRTAFIANATEFMRAEASKVSKAAAASLEVGAQVRIVSGSAKHLNKVGTITEARRVRVFVAVEGSEKPIYLFASDVIPVEGIDESAPEEDLAVNG